MSERIVVTVAWSVELEAEHGFDSIPTIEETYWVNTNGNYCCVFPGCSFTRDDAEAMWRHVQYAAKHRTPSPSTSGDTK
jgi:hypothetical protein